MKEDIPNCSWLDFTHSKSNNILNNRLFIFTGKGGTGKTTLSLAWAKFLSHKKRKILINDIGQGLDQGSYQSLQIPFIDLNLNECMRDYMAQKLGSVIISNWIMETSFFKSLFKILPGLAYITYLGKIIKMLQEDKSLSIIIDAESSGHALAMLEAPFNYKKIFMSGLLVNDLHHIIDFLCNKNNVAVVTVCTPNIMSITETQELITNISNLGIQAIYPIINNSFLKTNINNPPDFIKKKVSLEKKSIQESSFQKIASLPHLLQLKEHIVVDELSKLFEEIL